MKVMSSKVPIQRLGEPEEVASLAYGGKIWLLHFKTSLNKIRVK
jgi:hypothetical protein